MFNRRHLVSIQFSDGSVGSRERLLGVEIGDFDRSAWVVSLLGCTARFQVEWEGTWHDVWTPASNWDQEMHSDSRPESYPGVVYIMTPRAYREANERWGKRDDFLVYDEIGDLQIPESKFQH